MFIYGISHICLHCDAIRSGYLLILYIVFSHDLFMLFHMIYLWYFTFLRFCYIHYIFTFNIFKCLFTAFLNIHLRHFQMFIPVFYMESMNRIV